MSDFEEFEDENADDKIKADIESSDKMVRADAIARLAQKTAESGNTARAIVYLESCADLRTEIEDFTGLTFARIQLGWMHSHEKHYKLAFKEFLLAVDSARQSFNSNAEIDALHLCGIAQRSLKNYNLAADYFEQSLKLAVETDYRFVGQIKTDLARMLRKIGRDQEAEVLLIGATEDLQNNDFEGVVARTDNELASTLLNEGNAAEAFEKAKEAYHLADYNENPREVDRAQFLMARAKNKLGQHAEAITILEEMRTRKSYFKRAKHKVRTDLEFTQALAGAGRGAEAATLLAKIIPVMKTYKFKHEVPEALALQARLHFFADNALDAEQCAAEALTLAKAYELHALVIEVTYLLAACYEVLERTDDRAACLQQITSNPLNVGYQEYWFSASELALHFAAAGDVDAAQSYIDLIGSGNSPLINDAVRAQSEESQAVLLGAAGQKVKAKNMATKAMQTYLLSGNTGAATRVAQWVKTLG